MNVILRTGTPADAAACGSICFEAFKSISSEHGFPWDLPSAEVGIGLIRELLSNSAFYSVVAESGGSIVGSNFMDERGSIAGIGPITVDPSSQDQGIGRRLMLAALERAAERPCAGIRLVQSAYHNRSLCLYTKLGFDSREMLSKLDGTPLGVRLPGYAVRPAVEADLDICNALCRRVHGHDRGGELRDGVARGTARVVEHLGAVTAYATDIAFFGHAVAETNRGLEALIGAAELCRRWISCADPQLRAVSLVPPKWIAPGTPDDINDDRTVQPAGRRLPPFGALLTSMVPAIS
jgi:predicted N-acetyltransferase YhbS